jgi:ABC-2 type transport system ATP-binding protein
MPNRHWSATIQNMSGTVIDVVNLVRAFGKFRAVNDISFAVPKGEIFGFLGPNGAGKTTTIKVLCTLLAPTSGTATVGGYDCARDPDRVRAHIGIIFQDPSLDDRLTAEENLYFHSLLYRIPAAIRKERMDTVLGMVELNDRRKSLVREFSGGMKRRLEIARGLMHQPAVLFLDEPTLGLDPQTRHHIWQYLLDLRERSGLTIFLTTHYMDEAENCDRIAIIDQGKIIALDTPERLKLSVGRDVISLATDNDALAIQELGTMFSIRAEKGKQGGVYFATTNGESTLPDIIRSLTPRILSVSLKEPSLDDAFLTLTGRQIREEAGSDRDRIRSFVRRRRNL